MTVFANASAAPNAWFRWDREGRTLSVGGAWTVTESARLDAPLRDLEPGQASDVAIDASKLERLDSAGAWLLLRTQRALEAAGKKVGVELPPRYTPLFESLARLERKDAPLRRPRRGDRTRQWLARIGKQTIHLGHQGWQMLGYLGRVTGGGSEER